MIFHYSRDRRGAHPRAHLASRTGILQVDAYAALAERYAVDRQPGPILEAGCCAHARRKFSELASVEGAVRKKSRREKAPVIYPIALGAVRKGTFSPDMTTPPDTFDAPRERVATTIVALEAIDPDEIESFIGREMRFDIGTYRMDFVPEDFLLSFSQPNLYFHAATAHDILRMRGIEIGKRDFNGRIRKLDR